MNFNEKLEYLKKYEAKEPIIYDNPIKEWEPEEPIIDTDFKVATTDKAIEEGRYLGQGAGDHPNMNLPNKIRKTKITKEEAKEQGIVGQFVDFVSDFSLGMATGVGYGVDELAVSASKAINLIPLWDEEYTGRYISKYMDSITQREGIYGNGVVEAGRGIGQFVTGWVPALRAIQILGKAQKIGKVGQKLTQGIPANVIASSLSGATAFAPDHHNIGNDLSTVDNYLAGAVSEALATDPNDPEWKNRLRNALQEGGLALAGDKILVPAVKGIGSVASKVVKPVHEWFVDFLDLQKQVHVSNIKEKGVPQRKGKKILTQNEDGEFVVEDEIIDTTAIDELSESVGRTKPSGVVVTPEGRWKPSSVTFKIAKDQTMEKAVGDGSAFLNQFQELNTLDERMELMNDMINKIAPKVKESKADWNKKGLNMAYRAGLDPKVMEMIHKEGLVSPEIMYAFGHVAQSTNSQLIKAINFSKEIAGKVGATELEVKESGAFFARALADQLNVQQMLRNAKSTAGRSLRAAQTVVDDLGKNFNTEVLDTADAQQVLDFFRTTRLGGMELPRIVDMLYETHARVGSAGMNKVIDKGFKSGTMSMFVEAWINQGLLSNPATHMMNMVIGAANIASQPISQLTAATISKIPFANQVLGTEAVTYREAYGSMYGILAGLTKAFQVSLKAGVTGKSHWGGAKIDNYGMQHLAASSMDMEGTAMGLGLDYMGGLTRSSGRFLLMEDEFVKTVASEMQKHSLARRYAYANGLGSKQQKELYKLIIDNPEEYKVRIGKTDYSMEEQIKEMADLVTFQRETGKLANYISSLGVQYPLLKLGVPFVKVLANIPKFTVQHSPLGLVMQNKEFKRGGSARMLEMGRMAYGTMMMWYGANMYQNGYLTGSGPREYWKSINAQQTGVVPPRSYKIRPANAKANQAYWLDISRFSPYSNLLMMGADVSAAMDAKEELPAVEIIQKGLTSIQKNLVDPTWAPSLHKVLGVVADSSSEPGDWTRALKSISGTLQPSFVRAYEKTRHPGKAELKAYDLNPESIEAYQPEDWSGYMAQILATSSAHSDLVPTTRNFLGNEVKHDMGTDSGLPGILHNPVFSFLTLRKADETPALNHLMKDLEADIPRPRHIIPIGKRKIPVRLDPAEYEEYTKRIGKMKDEFGNDMKGAMTQLFNSKKYQDMYKRWSNPKSPEYHNQHLKKWMETDMLGVYNKRKRMARNSVILDFNLMDRSREVFEKFGGMDRR